MNLTTQQIAELICDNYPGGPYGFGTNLKAENPKPKHKYVQHLKNLRDAGWATPKEICPDVKNPISHEFAQFCHLGLANKYYNKNTKRVFYKITEKGEAVLRKANV